MQQWKPKNKKRSGGTPKRKKHYNYFRKEEVVTKYDEVITTPSYLRGENIVINKLSKGKERLDTEAVPLSEKAQRIRRWLATQ